MPIDPVLPWGPRMAEEMRHRTKHREGHGAQKGEGRCATFGRGANETSHEMAKTDREIASVPDWV